MIDGNEHTPKEKTRLFYKTVNDSMTSNWWQHSHNPTLGEVRGKYILVNKSLGQAVHPLPSLDGVWSGHEYNQWQLKDIEEKNKRMQDHINKARQNPNNGFYIGYASISIDFWSWIRNESTAKFAVECNSWLLKWLTRDPQKFPGKYGIIMMDWPGPGLIKRLYEHNFYIELDDK